jgi:hypothetical protein
MKAVWRNTLRIAGNYPHEKASRPDFEQLLAEPLPRRADRSELRVYYHPPFVLLSRLGALDPPPLYVMQVTDTHIDASEELRTLEAETYRRSNLHVAWGANPHEPFECEGLYAPLVTMFKDSEGSLLASPFRFAVLAVKFPRNPTIVSRKEGDHLRNYYDSERAVAQVGTIFRRALALTAAHGHQAVVFSDLGIHDGHPPTQLAALLLKELDSRPVPLAVVAAGDGNLSTTDPEYEELFRALRPSERNGKEEEE